ncbi:MAG: UvrD-helicase domain-containing protein [Oscillospiraceae bacterium]|nr:UvrD-helicase domain-containing protein [Oscillospiraceae bacterium]
MSDAMTLKKKALCKFFSNLNDAQREAVFAVKGPVLVLAGAGSGKTTAIISRIANLIYFGNAYNDESTVIDDEDCAFLRSYIDSTDNDIDRLRDVIASEPVRPWNVLAITFTNKAAGELRERLSAMLGDMANDITAATFHSACVRILRREIDRIGYSKDFTIYDADDSQRVVKACLASLDLSDKQFPPKSILAEISRCKDSLIDPEQYRRDNENDFRKTAIAKVYAEYQKRLESANALDFDDIIRLTVRILSEFDDVCDYYRNKYRYILVDEYQDTNHAQYRLVSLLAGENGNLCVVGDDDQSIYKFRGATIENILSFEEQFKNAKVVRLQQNYRSTQNILDAANSVIQNNSSRKSKSLWTDSEKGEKIVLYKAVDEHGEAKFVADTILKCIKDGGKYSDNAVLYRMNAQSNVIEKALVQSGIPYTVVGGLRFYDRKEIKDIVAYLSVINNPSDTLRLKRIINEPKRGIGDTTLSMLEEVAERFKVSPIEVMRKAHDYDLLSKKAAALHKLADMFDKLADMAESSPLDELLDTLLEESGYGDMLLALGEEGKTRLENINELKSTMAEYSANAQQPTLSEFLAEISLYTDLDKYENETDKVVLMTIHSAKGLEFSNVFLVGMEEGIFPGQRSIGSLVDLEEERRLAYVAITRARKKLYISKTSQRMLFGMTSRNLTSRFVKEIDKELIEKIDAAPAEKKTPLGGYTPPATVGSIGLAQQLMNKQSAKSAAKSNVVFSVGDRVKHNIFGEGTVLKVTPMANDNMLEVAFDKTGTKKLMANFAKITKV